MSTRYVWERYEISNTYGVRKTTTRKYTYDVKVASLSPAGISGYTYEMNQYAKPDGPIWFSIKSGFQYEAIGENTQSSGAAKYVLPIMKDSATWGDVLLEMKDNNSYYIVRKDGVVTVTSKTASTNPIETDFYICYPEITSRQKGEFIENVVSGNRSAYSDNGVTDSNWYIYKGSDTIDPYSVSYSKPELQAGEPITVSISPRSPTYGGTISYQYQYSTNGGSSWTTINNSTTATSATVTIPESATQFQARVRASDNYGFTSSTYVAGSNLAVSQMKGYVGINGKARAVTKLYVGVNGKARQVVKGYIGVGGKARRFL